MVMLAIHHPLPHHHQHSSSSSSASASAMATSRRQQLQVTREIVERERGRSRTISPVALARRAAHQQAQAHVQLHLHMHAAHPQQPQPQPRVQATQPKHHSPTRVHSAVPPPPPPTTPAPLPVAQLAESSSMARRREESTRGGGASTPQRSGASINNPQVSGLSLSRTPPIPMPTSPRATTYFDLDDEDEDFEEDLQPLPLPDQMMRAYAANNMHTARVLFLVLHRDLRLHFPPLASLVPSPLACLPSSSDLSPYPTPRVVKAAVDTIAEDDPRVLAITDEDFDRISGRRLEMDEEILEVLRTAERMDAEMRERRARAEKEKKEMERRCRQIQMLTQPVRRSSPLSTAAAVVSRNIIPKSHVSYHEIIQSLRGPLFPPVDTESLAATSSRRSPRQLELLESLLSPPTSTSASVDQAAVVASPEAISSSVTTTITTTSSSLSLSDSTTISRSNSWASTASTAPTSIASSPSHLGGISIAKKETTNAEVEKGRLRPALVSMLTFRALKPTKNPVERRSGVKQENVQGLLKKPSGAQLPSSVISLASSPLLCSSLEDGQDGAMKGASLQRARRPPLHKKVTSASRVVSAVLFDIADRVQRFQTSYIRAVSAGVTLALPLSPTKSEAKSAKSVLPSKSEGSRACVEDVKVFAPQERTQPCRALNFPSEFNVPLCARAVVTDIGEELCLPSPITLQTSSFASLPAPPSCARRRASRSPSAYPPEPEWRLRPVSNPALLRLKALQNVLWERGTVWEGRALAGSLGCGREKLIGVAFEGLGGSRLAFEAR